MSRILQATFSSKDSGGFIQQNVFHFRTSDDSTDQKALMDALITSLDTNISPEYENIQVATATLFDLSVRIVSDPASYTTHKAYDQAGSRDLTPLPGGMCATISWLPETGVRKGRTFMGCLATVDTDGDNVTPVLTPLLESFASAMEIYDGTDSTFHWRHVIVNADLTSVIAAVGNETAGVMTSLNKRMRA